MQLDLYRICIAAKMDREKALRFLEDPRSIGTHNLKGGALDEVLHVVDDVTKTRRQVQWMLQLLASGAQNALRIDEDGEKYLELFRLIEKYKLESKINLLDYKSYGEAVQAVEKLVPEIKQSKAERIDKGFTHVLTHNGTEIFRITDPVVSAKLGHSGSIEYKGKTYPGTEHWCTKDDKFCTEYLQKGPLYYIHTPGGAIAQLHIPTRQLMNEYDDHLDNDLDPDYWDIIEAVSELLKKLGASDIESAILYALYFHKYDDSGITYPKAVPLVPNALARNEWWFERNDEIYSDVKQVVSDLKPLLFATFDNVDDEELRKFAKSVQALWKHSDWKEKISKGLIRSWVPPKSETRAHAEMFIEMLSVIQDISSGRPNAT